MVDVVAKILNSSPPADVMTKNSQKAHKKWKVLSTYSPDNGISFQLLTIIISQTATYPKNVLMPESLRDIQ